MSILRRSIGNTKRVSRKEVSRQMNRFSPFIIIIIAAFTTGALAAPVSMEIPISLKVNTNVAKVGGKYWFKWVLFDTADTTLTDEVWSEEMDLRKCNMPNTCCESTPYIFAC